MSSNKNIFALLNEKPKKKAAPKPQAAAAKPTHEDVERALFGSAQGGSTNWADEDDEFVTRQPVQETTTWAVRSCSGHPLMSLLC